MSRLAHLKAISSGHHLLFRAVMDVGALDEFADLSWTTGLARKKQHSHGVGLESLVVEQPAHLLTKIFAGKLWVEEGEQRVLVDDIAHFSLVQFETHVGLDHEIRVDRLVAEVIEREYGETGGYELDGAAKTGVRYACSHGSVLEELSLRQPM